MHEKKFFIMVGPSGCGKTTLGNYAKEELGVPEVISHTTRTPREGEIDGVSYYFVAEDVWQGIEKAEYSHYGGLNYCISKGEVEKRFAESDVIFAITDLNGANQLKELYPQAQLIFVTIPLTEMERRMRARNDSEENIKKRINNAIDTDEHNNSVHADYVIENYILSESKLKLKNIMGL